MCQHFASFVYSFKVVPQPCDALKSRHGADVTLSRLITPRKLPSLDLV